MAARPNLAQASGSQIFDRIMHFGQGRNASTTDTTNAKSSNLPRTAMRSRSFAVSHDQGVSTDPSVSGLPGTIKLIALGRCESRNRRSNAGSQDFTGPSPKSSASMAPLVQGRRTGRRNQPSTALKIGTCSSHERKARARGVHCLFIDAVSRCTLVVLAATYGDRSLFANHPFYTDMAL